MESYPAPGLYLAILLGPVRLYALSTPKSSPVQWGIITPLEVSYVLARCSVSSLTSQMGTINDVMMPKHSMATKATL